MTTIALSVPCTPANYMTSLSQCVEWIIINEPDEDIIEVDGKRYQLIK